MARDAAEPIVSSVIATITRSPNGISTTGECGGNGDARADRPGAWSRAPRRATVAPQAFFRSPAMDGFALPPIEGVEPHEAPPDAEPMDEAAFLRFLEGRSDEERWELWDGVPVRMNPGTNWHGSIAGRLMTRLDDHFDAAGLPFAAYSEVMVRIPGHALFRPVPDLIVVDANLRQLSVASRFYLAVEVLSPSNTFTEIETKRQRYAEHPDCLYVRILEQDRPHVRLRARGDGWRERVVEGADATLQLPAFDFAVPLADVYRRVIGR